MMLIKEVKSSPPKRSHHKSRPSSSEPNVGSRLTRQGFVCKDNRNKCVCSMIGGNGSRSEVG